MCCAGKRTLIQDEKATAGGARLSPAQKQLDGFCLNTAFTKLLRGTCGRRKTAHLIAFFFGCFAQYGKRRCLAGSGSALQANDLISATKNLLNGRLLMSV